MYCQNCGKELKEGSKFCPNCGSQIKVFSNEVEAVNSDKKKSKEKKDLSNDLKSEEISQNSKKDNKKSNKVFYIIIAICALLLLFCAGLLIWNSFQDGDGRKHRNREFNKEKIFNSWNEDSYYDENGEMVKNQWVDDYYVGEDGKYVKNEWVKYGEDWYYCGPEGVILKSQWVDNIYYVDENGKMLLNTFTPDGYFVGEDGTYVEGKTLQNSKTSPLLTKAKEVISRIDPAFASSYVYKIDDNGNVYCHANYIDTVSWDEKTYRYKKQVYSEDPSLLEKEANDYLFVFYKEVGTVKMYRIYNIINKTDPTLAYSTFNSPDRVQVTKWNYEGSLQGDGGEKYNNYLMDLATFNSIK